MQQVADADFAVEAKFDSVPGSKFQTQGILVEGAAGAWLRFDVYSDGSRVRAFAASTTGGASTQRLSKVVSAASAARVVVTRSGSQWSLQVGAVDAPLQSIGSFTFATVVGSVGPYASNHGSSGVIPAFTAQVDYFFDLAAPIVPEDGGADPPPDTTPPVISQVVVDASATGATVTFSTDEPASSVVEFGTTPALGSQVPAGSGTSHSASLTGLAAETTYHFVVRATDAAGNTAQTAEATFTTEPAPPPDITPPVISEVSAVPSSDRATVSWSTDEATTGSVAFGLTSTYAGGSVPSGASGTGHSVILTGLSPSTTYHFAVTAVDAAGNTTTHPDTTFTTTVQNGGPVIDLWYGDQLVVGTDGQPQPWVNVLGRVTDPDGVASLTYRIGDGPERRLTVGPDSRRLEHEGDFNADIPWADLAVGLNAVTITATDTAGLQAVRTVTVDKRGTPPSAPSLIQTWTNALPLVEQALPVDGFWTVQDGTVRSPSPGYDRVLVLGNTSWTDYEVTVEITPLSEGPRAHSYLSGAPLLGLGLRWQGHEAVDSKQPAWGFYGTGAYGWVRWHLDGAKLELVGSGNSPRRTLPAAFPYGTTQVLKVRVETTGPGVATYAIKLWPAGEPEPAGWDRQIEDTEGPASGSLALISHHLDALFGPVTVTPL